MLYANDPIPQSREARRTGRNDCNRDVPAGRWSAWLSVILHHWKAPQEVMSAWLFVVLHD